MHVKIVGFKCHIDCKFEFSNNQITLLKGSSGAGKSTILQSIYWCLYGNMRGIYNNAGITKNLSVTLYLNNLIIHRKKNPELLQVTLTVNNEEKTFEDQIAQPIIDENFGNKELWRSCSYIEQKSRCALISGSNNERLKLLNSLSFSKENPKEYIQKISDKLKEVNQNFLLNQQAVTTEINLYQKDLTEKPVTVNISDADIDILKTLIENLTEEEKLYHDKVLEQERIVGSYNHLKTQITLMSEKLNRLSSEEIDTMTYEEYQMERDLLQNSKNKYEMELPHAQNREILEHELNNVNRQLSNLSPNLPDINITQNDIWQNTQQEQNRNKFAQMAKNIGVGYNSEIIQNTISNLNDQLGALTHLNQHLQNYNTLKSLKQKLTQNIDVSQLENLEKLSKEKLLKIADLKKGLSLLSCPKCEVSLRYQNNTLILGEGAPTSHHEIVNVEGEYQSILNNISKIRDYISIKGKYEAVEKSLNGVSLEDLENYSKQPKDLNQLKLLIQNLSKIQYIEPVQYSSTILSEVLKKSQLVNKKSELESQIIKIPEIVLTSCKLSQKISELTVSIQNLDTKYRTQKEISSGITNLSGALIQQKRQLQDLEPQLNPEIKDQYNKVKDLLSEKKTKLTQALWGQKCHKRGVELNEKRNSLLELHKDLTALESLKQKAVEVECRQLEDTVNNINLVLETTLPIFFREPISLKLNLFKTLKSKKSLKPGLNLEINYKGVKYDNINFLSGGEGDRLSLALLLALNSVSNSPMIMLDECVSSLDANLKESCIMAIKSIPDKTIICVDHEGVEGFYDSVIELVGMVA